MNKWKKSRAAARAKEIWRRFCKNKIALAGFIVLSIIVLVVIFANVIVPYEMATTAAPKERLQAPNAQHLFGTDDLGRDVFARIVHAAPNSLLIGFTVSFGSLLVGGTLGIACGYFGGKFDNLIMRFLDMISALPGSLLAIVMVAVLGPNMRNLIIALIVGQIAGFARMSRSVALSISEQEYIKAAKAGGSSNLRIIFRHAVPNAAGTLIINTTMSISGVILSACSLSFIGLGVQPPKPEWGAMLNDARQFFNTSPYLMIIPGLAILITSISINMMGDGLRDALDPKLKS
ncbi:ABC transporter permease [bacterium]|nr:ABC transporter permease [bacterium]